MAGFWSIIVPEATTNLVTNPSIGIDTTGFTAVGGSIARNTGAQKREVASLKITPTSGVNDGVYYGTVSLTNGQSYTFSVDIKGTDGEPYTIYFANTGGTKQGSSTDFNAIGDWERQEVTWACDSTASYRLYVTKDNDNNTGDFYVDGLQCENLAYSTTYIDGNQEGGKWAGDEHTSASERDAQSRLGGRLYNLDDYGFYIDDMPGIGMPPILHQTQEQPMLPGSLLRGFKTKPRVFDLIANQIGTTHEDLHSKRKDLLNAIKPDLVLEPQPFILRYTGANVNKPIEIRCVYDSGYQFTRLDGFVERQLPLRFIAYDEPYFYEIGNVAEVLTTKLELSIKHVCGKIDGQYDNLNDGTNQTVRALIKNPIDNCLYAGGVFTKVNGTTTDANYIAKYDGSVWSALGTGMNGVVWTILADAAGNIYAGGGFTTAGGSGANYIAKWNGSIWSALGTGLDATVYDMIIDPDNGNLIVVGNFDNAGGSGASKIAKWNGSAWSQISSATFDANALAIARHPNGDIFMGGSFTTPETRIARWDGSSWNSISTGINNQVNDIAISEGGLVYVGGVFTTAGGITVNRIALWNGSIWGTLGSGGDASVQTIGIDGTLIYAGGNFTTMGGLTLADRVALWNGYTWSHLDIDFPGSATVNAFVIDGDDIYYGFNTDGTGTVSYVNTITNNGSHKAYPKVIIKRSGGTLTAVNLIKNETTGAVISLNYSLLDGEELIIDFAEGNRSVISSIFGSVWHGILRSSNFADFNLLPGANTISVFLTESGSPTISAYMQWRNTHWSADGVAV